jgi:uncharacterized protein YkwD
MIAEPGHAAGDASVSWSRWSASPSPVDESQLNAVERAALARCGPGEAGLGEAARAAARRKLQGLPTRELDAVEYAQRAAGEPHPWPRVWLATAMALDTDAALRKLDAWLATESATQRRCGVAAMSGADGTRVLAVVTVDALADLAPLPTRARTGQWLTLEGRLRVAARGVRVFVTGPDGAPRTVPVALDGQELRARFAPDRPGEHAVQVVADLPSGPRPVLEASVFADAEPPEAEASRPAPGEDAFAGDDASALARMLAATRASAGLPPLARDAALDAVARAHARRMADRRDLAHDCGDGSPLDRLRSAGLEPRDAAENVAHAATPALAHRAQWWSPSHRANMLRPRAVRLGIGVARDERGDLWVTALFVD